jgi:AAA+ ATPase superfamily predicted ATPase
MSDNVDEYVKLIEAVIRRAGLEPGDCFNEEQQCWQFAKGSADIFISFIEIGGEYYINIASPIMAVPRSRREEFFRRLLEENGQRIAVKFSLRDDVAWLEINREIRGLGLDEAMRSLVRVAEVADELDQVLVNEYGDDWDS